VTRSLVFDISAYQGVRGMNHERWARLVAKGCIGAIIRASVGGKGDSAFQANVATSQSLKLVTAAYHYLEPGDIEAQADMFISRIGKLPAWLDVEQNGLTRAHVVRFVRRFRQKAGRGHFLGVYSSAFKWRALTGNLDAGELFDGQWSALYIERGVRVLEDVMATPPSRWGGMRVDLWQFGGLHLGAKGSPNKASVDGNVFDGNRAQFERLYGLRPMVPMDLRPARRKAYNDQLRAIMQDVSTTRTIPGQGKAWEDGVVDCRADVMDALGDLILVDPAA
jgi:GH25 family lysozyme M1 (1,4-beta-N-acetylmuramidase)